MDNRKISFLDRNKNKKGIAINVTKLQNVETTVLNNEYDQESTRSIQTREKNRRKKSLTKAKAICQQEI